MRDNFSPKKQVTVVDVLPPSPPDGGAVVERAVETWLGPASIGKCQLREQRAGAGVPWSLAGQRVAEIEKIIRERTSGAGLDTDDAHAVLPAALDHVLAREHGFARLDARRAPPREIAAAWVRRWLPAITSADFEAAWAVAGGGGARWTAAAIGAVFRVTADERRRLRLKTIRAVDQTDAARKAERRAADRERKRAIRDAQRREAAPSKAPTDRALAVQLGVAPSTVGRWRKAGKLAEMLGKTGRCECYTDATSLSAVSKEYISDKKIADVTIAAWFVGGDAASLADIVERSGLASGTVRVRLVRAVKAGIVERIGRGRYRVVQAGAASPEPAAPEQPPSASQPEALFELPAAKIARTRRALRGRVARPAGAGSPMRGGAGAGQLDLFREDARR